jgi:hypothetical protein
MTRKVSPGGQAREVLEVLADLAVDGAGELVGLGDARAGGDEGGHRAEDLPDADGQQPDHADRDDHLGEREAAGARGAGRLRRIRDGGPGVSWAGHSTAWKTVAPTASRFHAAPSVTDWTAGWTAHTSRLFTPVVENGSLLGCLGTMRFSSPVRGGASR